MTEKVIVLTTGGTISHRSKGGSAVMDFDPSALAARLGLRQVELEFRSALAKGSMDIVPDDWKLLAERIAAAAAEQPAGIVVLHGTDTMHYTTAAMTFMLGDLPSPVVFTGSMRPGGDPGTDAIDNLRDAVRVACGADLAEVCIVFSADAERSRAAILRGSRARKVRSFAINAFDSINAPPIGFVEPDRIVIGSPPPRPRHFARIRLATQLNANVVLIKITPALGPAMLADQLHGVDGAVLEGTGIGHIRADLQDVVTEFAKPTVMTTQALYGGERLGLYEADRRILAIPNLIPGGDMTGETALVKLMWALGQNVDIGAVMRTNIAGEIGAPADTRVR